MKDPDYPGRGILRCAVCHKPYITHEIGPCPELNVEVLHVGSIARAGGKTSGVCHRFGCALLTLPRKNDGKPSLYCSDNCRKAASKDRQRSRQ